VWCSLPRFYAGYVGISHALTAIAIFWLFVSGYRMTGTGTCVVAALLALLFAFDGLAMAIARFPHFTIFIVGTGMMLIVALVFRRFRIASIFFLCSSTREDAGFHLFALLSLLSALASVRRTPFRERKPALIFAIIGLLYSGATVALQHAFLRDHSLLISEYLAELASI
jgi:hypothetical protein